MPYCKNIRAHFNWCGECAESELALAQSKVEYWKQHFHHLQATVQRPVVLLEEPIHRQNIALVLPPLALNGAGYPSWYGAGYPNWYWAAYPDAYHPNVNPPNENTPNANGPNGKRFGSQSDARSATGPAASEATAENSEDPDDLVYDEASICEYCIEEFELAHPSG